IPSRNPCFTRTRAISIKAPAVSAHDFFMPSGPRSLLRATTATGSPNSDIIGGLAAREILSPLHSYTSRPGLRAFHGFLLGFSGRATDHLTQEFIYRWLTTHVPKTVARPHPILRDGTPVSLFSIEDLRSAGTTTARPITFVLSKDLEAGGGGGPQAGGQVHTQGTLHAAPPRAA